MLWQLGRPPADRIFIVTEYSHVMFFLFSLLFAGFSVKDLYALMAPRPSARKTAKSIKSAKREKAAPEETEMFVIDEDEED